MNKIYKGYELAEAVDNGILNLEQKVKTANNMEYYNCTIDFILKDIAKNIMFKEFEILEDNTEEIEELDKNLKFDDLITPYGKNEDMMWTEIIKQHNKIDEIIRYIKRKDKNND